MSKPPQAAKTKIIKVDYLARVEGEGALYIKVKDNQVVDVKLKIFEPPRFFEALLQGRSFRDAPDITARICGICPVAYQMSACHAMENAAGIRLPGPLRALRRLLYCGEWIESHGLHVFMLHGPDFLGYPSAIEMAKDHKKWVQMGLRLKKIGNDIGTLLGGREIHPINVRVGGFYKVPRRKELERLSADLQWAADAAEQTVQWAGALNCPKFEPDYEFVSLRHPDEYPMNEGRLVSNQGLDITIDTYEQHFEEQHIEYTNALHSQRIGGGSYLVGPLARYSLNFDRLTPRAQSAAKAAGLGEQCRNPFKSIIVRSVEILYACEEALRLIQGYREPKVSYVDVEPRNATGYGCTEAPRGILYHRYRMDDRGQIATAKIVPPTSQNQMRIEDDLWQFVPQYLDLPDEQLQWQCEQAIRNYDPCISCATHFLKLEREVTI